MLFLRSGAYLEMIERLKKRWGLGPPQIGLVFVASLLGWIRSCSNSNNFLDIPFPKHSKTTSPSKNWFVVLVRFVPCFFPWFSPCFSPWFCRTPTHASTSTIFRDSICSSRALGFEWPRKAQGRLGVDGWWMRSWWNLSPVGSEVGEVGGGKFGGKDVECG